MDAMIIISDKKIDMNYVIEQWKGKEVLAYQDLPYDENRWIIDSKEGHLYIDYSKDTIYDYEEGESDCVDIDDKHFYAVLYRRFQFLKKFLFETDFKVENLYIDDDHGTILPFDEFKMITENDVKEYYIPIIERKK